MEKVKLNELADIYLGVTHTPEYVFEGVPFLSVKDISGGKICFDDCKYISKEEYDSLSEGAKPKVGDMLFCRVGTLGKPIIIPEGTPLFGSFVSLGYLRNRNSDRCDLNYLRYWMYSNSFWKQVNANVKGASQVNLNTGWLSKFDIDLPGIAEQRYRISVLDKCKSVIEKREAELAALDDLIKARFVEMFGNGHDGFCNTKKLGEFCKFQQGTQIPVEEQIEEQLEGYTRFLRIIDYTQAPQIPRYVSVKGREIAEDSVVIVRYGATAGFVGHGYAGILANNLFEVVPDESILSKDFLYLALKYGTFEQEVHDKAFGAAMPALSFGMMNDIGVVTPNSTAQNGFVDFVKQVDKSKVVEGGNKK